MENLFHLKVASKEGPVFDGTVDSLTSFNEKGKFDILATHANFISLIKNSINISEVKKTPDGSYARSQKEVKFTNALLRVRENEVEVYIGV